MSLEQVKCWLLPVPSEWRARLLRLWEVGFAVLSVDQYISLESEQGGKLDVASCESCSRGYVHGRKMAALS